jgi:hypothetical protein
LAISWVTKVGSGEAARAAGEADETTATTAVEGDCAL